MKTSWEPSGQRYKAAWIYGVGTASLSGRDSATLQVWGEVAERGLWPERHIAQNSNASASPIEPAHLYYNNTTPFLARMA